MEATLRRNNQWSPTAYRPAHQWFRTRAGITDYSRYWPHCVDPDGNERNRDTDEERLQFLADHANVVEYVNAMEPYTVLDFGAGLGWFLSAFTAEIKVAIEVNPYAKARLESQHFIVADDTADIRGDSVDLAIAWHVIEHLVDPVYLVNHLHRVLTKGGQLILGTPDFSSPCAQRFGENYRMLHDRTHVSLFDTPGCLAMLEHHGFKVLKYEYPFPDRYATAENFARWNDTSKVSPPWPGNWVTFYAERG